MANTHEANGGTAEAINKAIEMFEEQMMKDDFQLKVADYIKLLELRQAMESARPRNVTAKWLDTWESIPSIEI